MLDKIGFNIIKSYKPVTFCAKNPIKEISAGDEFVPSSRPARKKTEKEILLGRLKDKVSPSIIEQKVNEILLTRLFTSQKASSGLHNLDTKEISRFVEELSKLDYNNIAEKYNFIIQEVSRFKRVIPTFIRNILQSENITVDTLKSLYPMAKASNSHLSGGGYVYRMEMMVYFLNHYPGFDSMSTKNQYDFIDKLGLYFDYDHINSLAEDDDLMRFSLIKDIKKAGSIDAIKSNLIERAKNTPVSSVPVDKNLAKEFIEGETFSYENLVDSIAKVNLKKYKRGFPLKYSREDFISDFKEALKNLNPDEKEEVFKYYQFNIDDMNDIIKFPIPNNETADQYPKKIQAAIAKTGGFVNKFMLENEIRLDEEDKKAQDILNKFIKVFPEFISVIGKIQHRRDSIDFHTLDDLQRCLLDPETKELNPKEQRILFLAVMFHDIAKKQFVIDHGHQKPSAYYAKEIIKKIPLSFSEKERIYNLILNSHWVTDFRPARDVALDFRYNNDFKMAQILARADGASAGFDFPITHSQLEDIQRYINKINSTGIPLFADNLPDDKSKFPINDEGIKYLDFTDENKDLSQYGFKKGTIVKDLNFLCHNTNNAIGDFVRVCDDSKDVCLSAEFKNAANKGIVTNYNLGYSKNCHIILHCDNENIAAGGCDVSCTGGKKGLSEFKNYAYLNCFEEPDNNFRKTLIAKQRSELSSILKTGLELDDEEYSQLFSKINEFSTRDDIQDITLSSGRIIKAEAIKEKLLDMQKRLAQNDNDEIYINEIVVFRPKIDAIIIKKHEFFNTSIEESEIKKVAKENNIPLILV